MIIHHKRGDFHEKKTGLIVILSLVIVLALCGIIAILILDPGRDAVLSKEASRKAAKAADASLRFGYSSENESSVPASDSLHTGSETEIPTEAPLPAAFLPPHLKTAPLYL